MRRSTPVLAMILCLIILASPACSAAAPVPTSPPPPTASFTPAPTVTKPPPIETAVPTATMTEIPIFWDDFSGEFLPGWTWIRENDALWSLDSEPGFLRIVLTGDNPPRNILVRDVSSENFQIMTHVRFKPTSNYQIAGLRIQDDRSSLVFGRAYCDRPNVCVGNGVYFDALQDGNIMGKNFATDTQSDEDAYLRIDKKRSIFTAYYSENGTDWMMIGEHELNMLNPKVGIMAGQSFIVGMTAYFDYFTVMELP